MKLNRHLIGRVLDILWLAALMVYVVAGYKKVPFHGDEATLLFMSSDYYYLVQTRDIDPLLYTSTPVEPSEQELRIINGTVGKMAMALAWDAAGLTIHDINEQWVWEWSLEQNQVLGHMPGDALLHAGRLSSALLAAASVVGVFLVARLAARRRIAAWGASLIYATTPAVLINGRRSMMEGSMLCFTVFTVLAAVLIAREQKRPSPRPGVLIGWYALLGVMGGLAIASKHNALMIVVVVFLAVLVLPLIKARQLTAENAEAAEKTLRAREKHLAAEGDKASPSAMRWRGVAGRGPDGVRLHLLRVGGAALLVIIVFLALNPAWWSNPLKMPPRVLDARKTLLDSQVAWYGGYDRLDARIGEFLTQAFFATPQYYEVAVWQDYVGDQIEAYEQTLLTGRGGGPVWGVLLVLAFGVGLAALLDGFRDGPAWIVLVWAVGAMLTLLIVTPMSWQRYYLPMQAPVAVVCGIGLGQLAALVARRAPEQQA